MTIYDEAKTSKNVSRANISKRNIDRSNVARPAARRDWYWLCAVEKETGTPIVDGPYNTEEEARQVGWEKIKQEFEVVPMKTIDKNRATAEYRHMRLVRFGDLKEVLKRTRHKL